MLNPFDVPGLRYVGDISDERINNGKPLPLFETVAPKGRPSINTLEGWNQLVAEQKRKHREADATV